MDHFADIVLLKPVKIIVEDEMSIRDALQRIAQLPADGKVSLRAVRIAMAALGAKQSDVAHRDLAASPSKEVTP